MSEFVIEGHQVQKVFKDFWGRPKVHAIKGIDISVPQGSIFGLLGPNGAGKSTLIKIILGHLYCTNGHMRVMGRNPRDVAIKQHIGYLPERTSFYTNLNTVETLVFFGRLLGLSDGETKRRSKQLIKMVGLENATDRLVGEFSHGMRKRLGLAQALLNDPDLLLLDEPTAGLDPIGCREIKDLIITLGKRGKTILMTSHLLGDVQDVCDTIMIVYGGKVQAAGEISSLLAKTDELLVRSPVVSEETINRVTETLRSEVPETNIDVSYPTRSLEDYFISIVEEANKRQEGTAGAQIGMGVAEYLTSAITTPEPPAQSSTRQPSIPKTATVMGETATTKSAKPQQETQAKTDATQPPEQAIPPAATDVIKTDKPAKQPPVTPKETKAKKRPPREEAPIAPNKQTTLKQKLEQMKAPKKAEKLEQKPHVPPPSEENLEEARALFGDGYEPETTKDIDFKALDALTRKR